MGNIFSYIADDTVDAHDSNLAVIKSSVVRHSGAIGGSTLLHLLPGLNHTATISPNQVINDSSMTYYTVEPIVSNMAVGLFTGFSALDNIADIKNDSMLTIQFLDALQTVLPQFLSFAGVALSTTTNAQMQWELQNIVVPPARTWGALTYGSFGFGNLSILFGGVDIAIVHNVQHRTQRNDTWFFDGSTWSLQTPTHNPSARERHAMVFSTAADDIILYGGRNNTTTFSDTWTFNGSDWTQQSPVSNPGPRASHAMCFDQKRGVAVLFGSLADNTTWEWSFGNWSQITTTHAPSARIQHAMAFDVARNVSILFGGIDSVGNILNDLWEYDGTDWTPITPSLPLPVPRFGASLTFDLVKRITILFGGEDINGNLLNDTWSYDGIGWTQLNIINPLPRANHMAIFDVVNDKTEIFGGSGHNGLVLGDFWELGEQAAPVLLQTSGDAIVLYDLSNGLSAPAMGDFLGPGFTPGSVTTRHSSPYFGFALEDPLTDVNTNLPLTLNIGNPPQTVGLIKMRIEPFYGFLTTSAPMASSFQPSSAIVGVQILVDGEAFLDVGDVKFTSNNGLFVSGTNLAIISNLQLHVTVPAGAQTGSLKLISGSHGTTITSQHFHMLPSITNLTPGNGAFGTSVTISGHTFLPAIDVLFNGVSVNGGFNIVNDTSITTTVPAGSSTGTVEVVTADGTAISATVFTVYQPPIIDSNGIFPTEGTVGSFITIAGSGFTAGGLTIHIVNVGLSQNISVTNFTIQNDNLINAQIPNNSTQGAHPYIIHIVSNGGSVNSIQQFTIISAPAFTLPYFLPVEGAAGTTIDIYGTAFTGLTSVKLQIENDPDTVYFATAFFISDTHITMIVPPTPGLDPSNTACWIIVSAGGGSVSSQPLGSEFFIDLQPTITSFTPAIGEAGTIVTLTGTNLLAVTNAFSTTAAATVGNVVRSGSTVTVTTREAHCFINGDNVFVASSDVNFATNYHVITVTGNTTFTYSNAGAAVSNSSIIYFGDFTSNTSFTAGINSDTQLIITISAKTLPGGTKKTKEPLMLATSNTLFAVSTELFEFIASPTISSVTATNGGYGNPPTRITINGTNLLNSDASLPTITFGGNIKAYSFGSSNATQILVDVPYAAKDNYVLQTDGGSVNEVFRVVQTPYVYFNTPSQGKTNAGGTDITIVGNDFSQLNGTTTIIFMTDVASYNIPIVSSTNTQITINTAAVDAVVGASMANSVTFTIYVNIAYNGGSYQIACPTTYTGFQVIG